MLIGRSQELSWLNGQVRLNRVLLLSGIRGVGKTKLVRDWLNQNDRRSSWYTLERYKNLSQTLKARHSLENDSGSLESIFEQLEARWQNTDIVVWDEAHLLSPADRCSLKGFIRNSTSWPVHIFISDEEITEFTDADFDVAQKILAPLTLSDVREYLNITGAEFSAEDAELAFEQSGGLPLLLHLWTQNKDLRLGSAIEKLNPREKYVLELASCLGRPFQLEELGDAEITKALVRKYLLEVIPENAEFVQVPSYVRSMCLGAMAAEEKCSRGKKLCEILSRAPAVNPMEFFVQSLRSADATYLQQSLRAEILDLLESFYSHDLEDLLPLMAGVSLEFLPVEAASTFRHIQIKALFLTGRRDEALLVAEHSVGALLASETMGAQSQNLALEVVQILSRSGQGERAREIAKQVEAKTEGVPQALIQMEKGASYLPEFPRRAQEILQQMLARIRRTPSTEWTMAVGHIHFHLARAMGLQDDTVAALENYRLALREFESAERPYYEAIALLNICWILLREKQWTQLQVYQKRLQALGDRFGYRYVLAGLDLMEAIQYRMNLQLNLSLQKVESSLKRLGETAPPVAILDAQLEKVRVLFSMGLRQRAHQILSELTLRFPSFADRIKPVEAELKIPELTGEDGFEKFDGEEELLLFKLRRGFDSGLFSNELPALQSFAAGALAIAENSLTQCLNRRDWDQLWSLIAKMERVCEKTPDPLAERVALWLLQAHLSKNTDEKNALIQKAELELSRWGCDTEIKIPFHACIQALQDNGQPIFDSLLWQKVPAGDRERWARWWAFSYAKNKQAWLETSDQGQREFQERPSARSTLYVIEHLAEVNWQGQFVPELTRRHALRRFLILLLEHGSQGCDKTQITSVIWGEIYNPQVHDSRIYTSVQRLRQILKMEDAVQNWNGGYRWNPSLSFQLLRSQQHNLVQDNRRQNLLLQTLERLSKNGRPWASRSQLVELTNTSETTLKRELAQLLSQARIQRRGNGRSVAYSLIS